MIKLLLVFICSVLSFSASAQTVAKVGSVNISKAEFEKNYQQTLNNSRSLTRPPTRKEHLEDMVRFKLGLQEAKKSKVKSNPLVKKSLELALYKGLLEVNLSKQVDKIKVSESEMKSYYSKNPHMRSSHIFIRLPKNPTQTQIAEAKARANKIYADVVTGKKKWSVYVRAYSDDEVTKVNSGDLGYHSSSSLYPDYYAALKPLKVGGLSKPFKGLLGFHIVKKTGQLSYERADKNATKIAVFNQKRFKILDNYFNNLKKKYKVSYNNDAL